MANKTFAVMGATGYVGKAVTEALLRRGHRVRAIGRDAKKLGALKAQGAEPVGAAFDDIAALAETFAGCEGAFVMIPPDYGVENPGAFQDRVGEHVAAALARSRVAKVVNLSSVGAQHPDRTGPVKGLHRQELRLASLATADVLHLRPCYFMQNLFSSMPSIREHGAVAAAIKPDFPIWMVAAQDVGRKAAELLDGASFTGKSVFEFVGPAQLTMQEAAQKLGKALQKPDLRYLTMTYADLKHALLSAGMKPGIAGLLVEMQQGFNEGLFAPTQALGPERRGSTAFESFAKDFALIYSAQTIVAA